MVVALVGRILHSAGVFSFVPCTSSGHLLAALHFDEEIPAASARIAASVDCLDKLQLFPIQVEVGGHIY